MSVLGTVLCKATSNNKLVSTEVLQLWEMAEVAMETHNKTSNNFLKNKN